jgi:hypothetical protein
MKAWLKLGVVMVIIVSIAAVDELVVWNINRCIRKEMRT